MLLKSTLAIEIVLMSPVRTKLLQFFKFFSSILESHSTIEGVISPSEKICVLAGKCNSNCCLWGNTLQYDPILQFREQSGRAGLPFLSNVDEPVRYFKGTERDFR